MLFFLNVLLILDLQNTYVIPVTNGNYDFDTHGRVLLDSRPINGAEKFDKFLLQPYDVKKTG